jgi:hypothetical protein
MEKKLTSLSPEEINSILQAMEVLKRTFDEKMA